MTSQQLYQKRFTKWARNVSENPSWFYAVAPIAGNGELEDIVLRACGLRAYVSEKVEHRIMFLLLLAAGARA